MAKIPQRNLLNEMLEDGEVEQAPREYIGMSSLGGKCKRKIWYDFRLCYKRTVPKRINRLFRRGDYEEAVLIRDMQEAGIICEFTGENQYTFCDDTGHIKGHPDGKLLNVPGFPPDKWHLFEAKTMKSSIFTNYLKNGLEKTYPVYWGQAHTYMGEWGLDSCIFAVVNKDTDQRDFTQFNYDPVVHRDCMSVGFDVLTSEQPPKKIGEKTWFECKTCSARGICHKGEPIQKSCRTCQHVDIEEGGRWFCNVRNTELSFAFQKVGCEEYEIEECLI